MLYDTYRVQRTYTCKAQRIKTYKKWAKVLCALVLVFSAYAVAGTMDYNTYIQTHTTQK